MSADKIFYISVTGIVVKDNTFLIVKRSPHEKAFPGRWTVPGGKIYFDETIEEAATRIAKREIGTDITVDHVCGIVDEQVHNGKPKHGWLLFIVKARATKAHGKWVAIKDLDAVRIIESDKWMMRNLLNKKLDVNHVVMHERPEGMSFSVLPLHS